jgi:hypothetical protein
MLICIFAQGTLGPVTELDLSGKGIRDEDIHESAPLVRALVLQRLEQLWRTLDPYVSGDAGKPDPRFLESGIRVLDRLVKLYRLDRPVPQTPEATDLTAAHELVQAGLRELEARMADTET